MIISAALILHLKICIPLALPVVLIQKEIPSVRLKPHRRGSVYQREYSFRYIANLLLKSSFVPFSSFS